MGTKYDNLDELRRKKALLKAEVEDMNHLLTFEDKKESLSALTNGFTDRFLDEQTDETGEQKLTIKTGEIVKEVKESLTQKNENSAINFDNTGVRENVMDNVVRLGSAALVGGIAKRNLRKRGWKNKLIGLAIIYLLPGLLRIISRKLAEYQKRRSISSMEQLI